MPCINRGVVCSVRKLHLVDKLFDMLFRIVTERWEQADGFLVVSQTKVDDLEDMIDRNDFILGNVVVCLHCIPDLAHASRFLSILRVAERVQVLLSHSDNLIVLVHHRPKSHNAAINALDLFLFSLLIL